MLIYSHKLYVNIIMLIYKLTCKSHTLHAAYYSFRVRWKSSTIHPWIVRQQNYLHIRDAQVSLTLHTKFDFI